MNFPYDAVLFDFDGTLLDSKGGIIHSYKMTLEEMGFPIPDISVMDSLIGPPMQVSFTAMGVPAERLDEAIRRYRANYRDTGLYLHRLFPGVRNLLRTLKENGVYIAVASTKPQYLLEIIADYLGLNHFFDRIVGIVDDAHRPGKEVLFAKALEGSSARRPIVVGDREFDTDGALAAGLDCIGVLYGFGSREEFAAHPPTFTVESVEELTRVLCPGAEPPRGLFLSLEGPDGCGKTTQLKKLEAHLLSAGFDVHMTREPGGSPISEKIRALLLDVNNMAMTPMTEALLYAAARAQHVREVIRPAVAAGKTVLCDRFVDSSIAYQGGGRQMGTDLIEQINLPAVDGTLPDMTVYLDLDHETAMSRRTAATEPDRLELAGERFHARVEDAYHRLAEQAPERILPVSALGTPDEVAARVWNAIAARLPRLEVR